MSITIKQLSGISGFSTATISRVIAGGDRVKPETKEAVERLLEEYQYRTNIMELRSRARKKKTILVIVGNLETAWHTEQIRVIRARMLEAGYTTLIGFTDNLVEEEEHMVKLAREEGYAGLCIINVRGGDRLQALLQQYDIPVVFLNREIKFSNFDVVIGDKYMEGYIVTRYLTQKNHRRIGYVQGDYYASALQERLRGYQDAMVDGKAIITKNSVLMEESSYAGGYAAGKQMIEKGLDYTALVCSTESMVLGLVTALRDYGVRIPEDVSVVSCDDGFYTRYFQITVAGGVNPDMTARKACELLLKRLDDSEAKSETVVYRPEIIERSSVRCV